MNEELENIDWTNSFQIIAFYEKNSIYFNNYDFITNQDKICQFISLKLNYSFALIDIGSNIDKVNLIYNEITYLIKKLDRNNIYYKNLIERELFLKSILFSYNTKYYKSNKLLRQLIAEYPENNDYKKWIKYNELSIINYLLNYLITISILIVIISFIFFGYDISKNISLGLIIIVGLIYIVKNIIIESK